MGGNSLDGRKLSGNKEDDGFIVLSHLTKLRSCASFYKRNFIILVYLSGINIIFLCMKLS